MSALGKLVVSLALENAQFTKGLDKSSQEALTFAKKSQDAVDKAERAIKGSMSNIATSALGAVAAFASVSSVINGLKSSINVLGQLDDMAQKTGSSVENLSKLQKVAVQFGQDFNVIDVKLSKFARGLAGIDDEGGKTAQALKAIGISQEFVKANDPSAVMVEVAKRLQGYQDGASKAALATDLFGKAGVELLPFLNDAAGSMDKFQGVSDEAAARAAKLQDDIGGLKVKFQELFDTLTIGIIPSLDAFISRLNQVAKFKSIFSSVGGIDVKDADKEIAVREVKLKKVVEQYNGLAKDTVANNLNEAIFGDKKTLQEQIKIFTDEINALKDLKKARDDLTGSPNSASPNLDGKKLNYGGEEAANKAKAEAEKLAKSRADAAKKSAAEIYEYNRKFDELNAENIQKQSEAQYKREIDQLNETQAAKDKSEKEDYDNKIKNINLLFDASQRAVEEERRLQEQLQRDREQANRDFARSLTDALFRGFENGKSFLKNFRDTLINSFQTLILRPRIEAIISGTGLGSLIPSANASTGGGFGSSGNIFGDIKSSIDQLNSGFKSSIESLGTFLSTGNGGLGDKIGGFIGQYSGEIAGVAPYLGSITKLLQGDLKGAAFTAAGTAIGTAFGGPVGGAIGSIIGSAVSGLFGGKKQPKRTGGISNTSLVDGVFSQNNKNIFNRDMKASAPINQAVDTASESFAKTLSNFSKMFGGAGDVSSYAQYFGRPDGSSYQRLSGTVDGVDFMARAGKGKFGDKDLQDFISKITGEYLAKAIQSTGVPEAIKKLFVGVTESSTVQSLINVSGQLNDSQKQLAERFGLTLNNSVDMATQLGLTGDSLATYLGQLGELGLGFKTESQVMQDAKDKLIKVLGSNLPDSIEEFDAKIKAIDKSTSEGLKEVSDLLGIRAGFIAYENALDSLNSKLVDSSVALGLIDSSNYQDRASFEAAQAFAGQGLRGIYNSSDVSANGTLVASELQKLREGIAELIKQAQATSSSTLQTARVLMQVTDGASLITTAG